MDPELAATLLAVTMAVLLAPKLFGCWPSRPSRQRTVASAAAGACS